MRRKALFPLGLEEQKSWMCSKESSKQQTASYTTTTIPSNFLHGPVKGGSTCLQLVIAQGNVPEIGL